MPDVPATCTAINQGVECTADATMVEPVPLCDEHQLQVVVLVVPDLLTAAHRHAGAGVKPVPLPLEERAAVVAGAPPRPVAAYMGGTHGPVVYFADAGARIKIGFSTNLRNRIRSLSMQEKDVVLLLRGGLTLERALHDTFAKERIDSTEWFEKSDRLMSFIQSKLAGFNEQHQRKAQRQQRRRMATSPAPSGTPLGSLKREDRMRIIRELIDGVGGNPTNLPLRAIQDRFGVHKSTASRMRSEASAQGEVPA